MGVTPSRPGGWVPRSDASRSPRIAPPGREPAGGRRLTARSRIRDSVSEMKQSDSVARESLEILNGLPHAAALLDAEGRLIAMNGRLEALTGHSSEDVRGVPGDHVVRSRSSHDGTLFGEALRTGAPVSVDSDVLTADRRRLPVRITASPLKARGSASALLLFVEDVSASRKPDAAGEGAGPVPGILGSSPQMHAALEMLPVVARTDAT